MLGILGQFFELITVLIYVSILIIAIIGFILFNRAHRKQIAFWWLSLMVNIFSFLYLTSSYGFNDLIYYAQIFTIIAWPIVNIGWLVSIISTEKKKTKNNQVDRAANKNFKKIILTLAGIIFFVIVVFYLIISNFAHQFISGT